MIARLLRQLGYVPASELHEAHRQRAQAIEFARALAEAEDEAVIVGTDYAHIHDVVLNDGRRILVVPGCRFVTVSNVMALANQAEPQP